jgi:GGDEF domain-containing protein
VSGSASRAKTWAALTAAWAGIGTAVVLYLEPGDARILVPIVAGFVVVLSLWHPFPRAGTVLALPIAAIYVGARYLFEGPEGFVQPAVAAAIAIFGLGVIADALTARAEADALQRRHDSLLIEELTPTSSSGAMKWQHAQKQLADEIARGRRYKYPVSLVLVGLDRVLENAPDSQVQAAVRQRSALIRLLLSKMRSSDHVAFRGEDQLALVLPHTPAAGALAFLDKNLPEIKIATGIDPRIGVAEFPTDAGSPEDLVTEAESALEFGRASGMRIVSRSTLMGTQEITPGARGGMTPRTQPARPSGVQSTPGTIKRP